MIHRFVTLVFLLLAASLAAAEDYAATFIPRHDGATATPVTLRWKCTNKAVKPVLLMGLTKFSDSKMLAVLPTPRLPVIDRCNQPTDTDWRGYLYDGTGSVPVLYPNVRQGVHGMQMAVARGGGESGNREVLPSEMQILMNEGTALVVREISLTYSVEGDRQLLDWLYTKSRAEPVQLPVINNRDPLPAKSWNAFTWSKDADQLSYLQDRKIPLKWLNPGKSGFPVKYEDASEWPVTFLPKNPPSVVVHGLKDEVNVNPAAGIWLPASNKLIILVWEKASQRIAK